MSAATKAWSIGGGVLFAGSVLAYSYNAVTLLGHETYREDTVYSAADVTSIRVSNHDGSVTVIGTDAATAADSIQLAAEVSSGIRATEHSHRVVDGVLEVRSSCPNFGSSWCEVTYTLEVPHDMATTVRAENGAVRLTDLSAAVTVDADNGSVRVVRIAGPVVVSADNGGVVAEELSATDVRIDADNGSVNVHFASSPELVDVSSDNGSVTIEVPRQATGYNVDAGTDNGGLHIDVLDNPDSDRAIAAHSDNGTVRVRHPG